MRIRMTIFNCRGLLVMFIAYYMMIMTFIDNCKISNWTLVTYLLTIKKRGDVYFVLSCWAFGFWQTY